MTLQIKSNPSLDTEQMQALVSITDLNGQTQLLLIKTFEHVYIHEIKKITFCHVFSVKTHNSEVLVGVSPVDDPRTHYLAKYEPMFEEVLKTNKDQLPLQFSELNTIGPYPTLM